MSWERTTVLAAGLMVAFVYGPCRVGPLIASAAGVEPLPPGVVARLGPAQPLHGCNVFAIAFSPDSRFLALGGQDRSIHLWDVRAGKEISVLEGHVGWILSIAFSPDGKLLASAGRDQSVRLWQMPGGEVVRRLSGQDGTVLALTFSPDGQALASASQDKTIVLWDVATGRRLRRLSGHDDWVGPLIFSQDSRLLVSGSWDGTVREWDVAAGKELRRLGPPRGRVLAIALSADGTTVAAASRGRALRRWRTTTGDLLQQFGEPEGPARCLAFSSDGKLLVSGSKNGTLRLWDTISGQEYRPLGDGRHPIQCLAFSPDGKLLATCGPDAPTLLWNLAEAIDKGRPGARKMTSAELDHVWAELAAEDGPRIHRSLWDLRQSSQQSVPFLKERFDCLARDSQHILDLIAQLDDDKFAVRNKAVVELEQLGALAAPDLRAALQTKLSLDVERQLERLLDRLQHPSMVPHPNIVRGLRALRALGQIDSPEARELLKALAEGRPTFWVTQAAKATLENK